LDAQEHAANPGTAETTLDGSQMKPYELAPFMPFLPNAFGKYELEFAAVLVILWHLENGLADWTPVDCRTLIGWARSSNLKTVQQLCTNPFSKPDFLGLRDKGFVSGWATGDDLGVFSELGLRCLDEMVEGFNSRRVQREKAACSAKAKID
jgi:hypothetical protein